MTRQVKKLAHAVYECKYQAIFCPKYRYKILQSEAAKYVKGQIYRLSNQKDGIEVLEVNVQPEGCPLGGVDTTKVRCLAVHGPL